MILKYKFNNERERFDFYVSWNARQTYMITTIKQRKTYQHYILSSLFLTFIVLR